MRPAVYRSGGLGGVQVQLPLRHYAVAPAGLSRNATTVSQLCYAAFVVPGTRLVARKHRRPLSHQQLTWKQHPQAKPPR